MLMNAAEFLIKKAVETRLKGKKVDMQILQCYSTIYLNYDFTDTDYMIGIDTAKERATQMIEAIRYFDKTGNPENMYVSFCMFFDQVLTKKEYYFYADQLLKQMATHNELITYLDFSDFKIRIMEDLDPQKVDFPKTNTMIYKDAKLLSEHLNTSYIKTKGGIVHDVTTSRVIHKASKYADLTKPIYAYTIDPHLNVKLIPDKDVEINIEEDSITVMISSRCSISFSNYPLTPKK